MARRKPRQGATVNLFPFLSILACVIGVLTLLITGLALQAMQDTGDDTPEVQRAQEYLALQKEQEKNDVTLKQMHDDIQLRLRQGGRQYDLQAKLVELEKQKKALDENQARAAKLNEELKELNEKSRELTEAIKLDETQLARKKDELKERKETIEAAPGVIVRPGGSGVDLVPTFVECDAKGIVMHDTAEPRRVLRAAMSTNLDYIALLDRVALDDKGTVIFLVRPDGVNNYYLGRSIALSRYARNGKLPVPGEGALDLTLFRELLKKNDGAPSRKGGA
ncbi:MAG: hypothetical protein WD768_05445 [Phycisphaeraceae bacterium]